MFERRLSLVEPWIQEAEHGLRGLWNTWLSAGRRNPSSPRRRERDRQHHLPRLFGITVQGETMKVIIFYRCPTCNPIMKNNGRDREQPLMIVQGPHCIKCGATLPNEELQMALVIT